MINVGILQAILKLKDQMTPALGRAQKSLRNFGSKAKQAGMRMIGVSLALAGAGAAALKFAIDMNKSMANVATLIPGSTQRVLELKKGVQDLAIETGKSTADLADGLYQVVSAFGDTADTAKILEINARAATAGLATTTDAINLTSAVTKGYGDTSAEATAKVADLAFIAVKLGQTTFPELAQSIGRVVPLTAELKVSQEELFGVMATATGVTGGAAEVSTQLRGVMQSLLAPTKSMEAVFTQLGVETGKAAIEQEGLQGVINAVTQMAKQSGEPLQKYIGSIEGQTLALALAGPQAAILTEKTKEMMVAAGGMSEAYQEQTEGINAAGHAWNQMRQAVVVMMQEIGDSLVPLFRVVVELLKDQVVPFVRRLVKGFSELSPVTQQVIAGIAGLVVVGGPLLILLGMMATAIGAVSVPLVLVVAGVGAAIAIFLAFREEIVGFIENGINKLIEGFDNARLWLGLLTEEEHAARKAQRELTKEVQLFGPPIALMNQETKALGQELAAVTTPRVYQFGTAVKLSAIEVVDLADNIKHLRQDFPGIEAMPLVPFAKFYDSLHLVNLEAERAPSIFKGWGTSVKQGFNNLWQGMTGGTGKLSGMFDQLGHGIINGFGHIVAGGMTSLINKGVQLGIQGLAKLGSWIRSKFGPAEAEKDARAMVQVFEQMVAQSLTQEQMAEAGGERWKQITIGVRDAYLAAGLSVEEAMRDVESLWEATKQGPDAVQSVIDKVQELAGEFHSLNALELQDKYMDIHASYRYANERRDMGQETESNFQSGTGGRYVDFGSGSPVVLHGKERIVTEAEGSSDSAILQGIRRDLKTMPIMIRDAIILAG
jgi:TP901 family phage tail tape measure protein